MHNQTLNYNVAQGNRKAHAVFYKHQLENAKFVLFLFFEALHDDNHGEVLSPALFQRLKEAQEGLQYPPKKRPRRPMNDTEKRKYLEDFLKKIIRDEFFGNPVFDPLRDTVSFNNLTVRMIGDYICGRRNSTDGTSLLRGKVYSNIRSSVTFFYKRYKQPMPADLKEELQDLLKGVNRTVALAEQSGQGDIEEGKKAISLELYRLINKWFLQEDTKEAIFARAFASVTWNLNCRGESTASVCHKHLVWRTDALGIPFAHEKNNQTGDSRKKQPRHCYSNPFDCCLDGVLALFEYLACFPEVLVDKDGPLFPGADESQTKRFSEILRSVLLKHEEEVNAHGFEVTDISIHSFRKGGSTYCSSGTTAAPSGIAVNLRGGWSMGGVRDVYFLYEKAGDQYMGRLLAGLNVHSPEFAVSEPDFVPVADGITQTEMNELQQELDVKVEAALKELFGGTIPLPIRRTLRVGLACHLHHRAQLEEYVSVSSQIHLMALYRSSSILSLKDFVKVHLPWKEGTTYFQRATGIPPHVVCLAHLKEIKEAVDDIVPNVRKIVSEEMDDRTMNGVLSERRMQALIENSPLLSDLKNELKGLREAFNTRVNNGADCQEANRAGEIPYQGTFREEGIVWGLWHHHGKLRRCPPQWSFPNSCSLAIAYDLWHCGDDVLKVSPLKYFKAGDVDYLTRGRKNLNDFRLVVTTIDAEAKRRGLWKAKMTREEARKCLIDCKYSLGVSGTTPAGRQRRLEALSWSTFLREMPQEIRKRKRGVEEARRVVAGGRRDRILVGGAGSIAPPNTNTTTTTRGTNSGGVGRALGGAVGGNRGTRNNQNNAGTVQNGTETGAGGATNVARPPPNNNNRVNNSRMDNGDQFAAEFGHVDASQVLRDLPRISHQQRNMLIQHNRQTTPVTQEGDPLLLGGQRVNTTINDPNASDPGFQTTLQNYFRRG